jgi:hypothetical protein
MYNFTTILLKNQAFEKNFTFFKLWNESKKMIQTKLKNGGR